MKQFALTLPCSFSLKVSTHRWLVSSDWQAADDENVIESVSSIAFCIAESSLGSEMQQGVVPSSGLFSGPCRLPIPDSSDPNSAPAEALASQTFLVCGQFYLSKGRRIMQVSFVHFFFEYGRE